MFSKSEDKATAEVVPLKSDDMSVMTSEEAPPPYVIEENGVPGFEIKYKDWKCTRAVIRDPQSQSTVYTAELPTLKRSHINLKSANDELQLASSSPYNFKTYISTNIRGQALDLHYEKFWKCSYSYVSPAFNNAKMVWTCHSKLLTSITYVLLDEQHTPIARWTISGPKVGPFKDLGSVEFFGNKVDSQTAKEEILITGLTVIFLEIVARSNGTIGVSALATMAAVAGHKN